MMKEDYKRILKKELHDLEQALRKETETYMCCALTMALLLKQLPSADAWLNELWEKFDAAEKAYEADDREAI